MRIADSDYILALHNGARVVNYARFTFADGRIKDLQPSDFRVTGNSYTDKTTDSNAFSVGSFIGKTANICIDNSDGRFDDYDFYMSRFILKESIAISEGTSVTVKHVVIGEFTVVTDYTPGRVLNFSAVDATYKFDKTHNLTGSKTFKQIISAACNACLGSSTFDGTGNFSLYNTFVNTSKLDAKLTWRQLVSYVAIACGYNAYIDETGLLKFKWYDTSVWNLNDLDGGTFSTNTTPYSDGDTADGGDFTFSESTDYDGGLFTDTQDYHIIQSYKNFQIGTYDISITGVRVVNGESVVENSSSHDYGYSYVIEVKDNPLCEGIQSTIADHLANKLLDFTFRIFSCSVLCDPLIEAGDMALVIDTKGIKHRTLINSVDFSTGGYTHIACQAESIIRQQASYTSEAAKAVVEANRHTDDTLSSYDESVQRMNRLAQNATGLYDGRVKQSDGSYINYVSDHQITYWPDGSVRFVQHSFVAKETGDGYFYSTDSGTSDLGEYSGSVPTTWTGGLDKNGNAVLNTLSVYGLSADWINAGSIATTLITALDSSTAVGSNTLADFATKASTIIDVDVEYAKNQSSTTAPTSGWSTSSPQWEEGYYIWQRTKTTDGNSQASYSTPVCIQGAKGQDGTAIASVTVTYGTSSSPNTQPSTWYNNIPSVADGDYLWIRTITDYSDTSVQDTVTYTYSRQGENGQDGTSVSVSSIQYQQGDSATTAPTGTWSNTPVTVDQGKYLWTKTTFSNGSIAYGVARQGEDGADGNGISSVTISYGTSSSASTQPSSWQTTIPTVADGDYLWIRTVTDYTDPSVQDTVTYTYSRQGEDGQQGQAGTSVTVSSIQYQEGTSATSAPTGTWSNNPVTVAQGNYLWTKTTFSNGSIAYGIARQGEDGTDGTDGSDGVGVSAIVEQYYLSTSDQSPTGGSWSTSQPAWEEGKYIWTRSHVTWTDSTTTDTSPVLAQAINGANQAVQDLDDDLDQDEIFNRLIGGDTAQGIVLKNGKLYLRGEYLEAGAITIGGSAFANNPTIVVKDASNTQIGSWTKDGISIIGGSIAGASINVPNASSPLFKVDSSGNVTASAGKIGDLNLANGMLSVTGTREILPTTQFNFKAGKATQYANVIEFVPLYLGLTGSYYTIKADYYIDDTITNLRFYLDYKSGNTWDNSGEITVDKTSGWHYGADLFFMDFRSDDTYRIRARCNKGSSSYERTFKCKLYIADATVLSLSSAGGKGVFAGTHKGTGDFGSVSIGGLIYNSNGINVQDDGTLYDYSIPNYTLGFTGVQTSEDSSHYASLTQNSITTKDGNSYIDMYSSITPTLTVAYDSSNYFQIKGGNGTTPSIEAKNGGTRYYVNWQNGSDKRIKENITDLDNKLSVDFIDKTQPKRFKYIKNDGIHYGMIAQDARELLDELGETDAVLEFSPIQEDDFRAIRYEEYIPHLINYVKDLRAELNRVKAELNKLKEEK